jgi:predicted Holliday junction resolvase-like endonuclease
MIIDASIYIVSILSFLGMVVFGWLLLKEREKVGVEKARYNKLFNQKKSSEVRVGRIGENIAPFLDGWPYDSNNFRFLGNPIDGIQFNDDEIIFIEIKTGRAQLSSKQRNIKKLLSDGKVSFATFRIGEEGVKFTKEEA